MYRTASSMLRSNFVRFGAAAAVAAGLYKFNTYAANDHMDGQNYGMAMLQTAYWIIREQCGLIDEDIVPFKEEDITAATIQHCLREGGKVSREVKGATNIDP